jgi:hypothetical protein
MSDTTFCKNCGQPIYLLGGGSWWVHSSTRMNFCEGTATPAEPTDSGTVQVS